MDIQEKIDVLTAYRDGKQIEVFVIGTGWLVAAKPEFDFKYNTYRVKKEPGVVFEIKTELGYHQFVKAGCTLSSDIILKKYVEVLDE